MLERIENFANRLRDIKEWGLDYESLYGIIDSLFKNKGRRIQGVVDIPAVETEHHGVEGLIVDIAPPDFELRCAITQIKAADKGLDLASDLVHLIAGNIEAARQIEGFLVKLMSQVKLKKIIPDADLIESLLNKRDEQDRAEIKKRVEPDQIVEAVCKYYSISRRAMLGKVRARLIARPRQVLMYLLRTEISLPLIEVGRVSGGNSLSGL